MEMNLNALRMRINDLKKDYTPSLRKLQYNSTIEEVKEINGNTQVLSAPFDFNKELSKSEDLAMEIARLNGILAKENNTVMLSNFNITIQEGILILGEMRNLLKTITYVLSNTSEGVERQDGYRSGAEPYYKITKFNFDKEALTKKKEALQEYINSLETDLTTANTTTIVSI